MTTTQTILRYLNQHMDTIQLMHKLHKGQVDKAGAPYWEHPFRVMLALGPDATADERTVALLHDVLEDTLCTADGLLAMGYSAEVVTAIQILTRQQTMYYEQYILGLIRARNPIAIKVKRADLRDNLRPGGASPSLRKRYVKALKLLEEV